MIPILELVREGREGLEMLKGNLMKLNRAINAIPVRIKSVSLDRTLRWRFIVRETEDGVRGRRDVPI
jgi:hypothetical protein